MRTLLAIVALSAASATASAQTEVTVWHPYRGQEKAALETVAAAFDVPGVSVKLVPIPYDAFADKISVAIPRGKGPDLFIFAQDRLGDWAASELIEPIDFWLTDDNRAAYLEPTLDALTYDEQAYGLPMAFKTVALFYDAKLVQTPPATTDDLIRIAKKHTNVKRGRFGLVYENANFYYQAAWMQGFGGRVFDDRMRPTLAEPPVIASMRFAQRIAHDEGIMPEEVSGTLVTSLFNEGRAAFVINGPWFIGELSPTKKYGVAPLPTISESGQPARPFLTVEGLIMSAQAKDKKAAFKVQTYFTGTDAGRTMAKLGRQTPARAAVYDDPEIATDPILSVFKAQLAASTPMPNAPAMRMVWSPVTTAMNKIINAKKDSAEAMTTAQTEIKELVKGARR